MWQAGAGAAVPDGVRCCGWVAASGRAYCSCAGPPLGAAPTLDAMAAAAGRLPGDREKLRQTGARLAELGMLNEVATAMSSTLDLPVLLEDDRGPHPRRPYAAKPAP